MADNFITFKFEIQNHFREMLKGTEHLYKVDLNKDELWNLYLDSFPAGTNDIFRVRREHDCGCCRQFIRAIGNVVSIDNNYHMHTIWELKGLEEPYQTVANALDAYVRSHSISGIYISKVAKIGTDHNFERLDSGEILPWDHLYLELPERFVDRSKRSIGDITNEYNSGAGVFKRSLEEIDSDAVSVVLELIGQNSLYKGREWKHPLGVFLVHQERYSHLSSELMENYIWKNYESAGPVIGKIRNHSIGTLLVDITNGVDLDEAVRKYEKIVAPENYKRPKPIYTKKMLEQAEETVKSLGYFPSLPRRFATLDDIRVSNILFANRDAAHRISSQTDVFSELKQGITIDPKKFSKVQAVTIEDFIHNVLPTANSVELLLENRHTQNMVSLITAQNASAPSMFKWGNNFSWAYTGNITDSSIKQNVKAAGGTVNGVLRFSIQWNDGDEWDQNDLDAHCIIRDQNGRSEIFFANPFDQSTRGALDIDIQHPAENSPAVENIIFPRLDLLREATYIFYVRNYCHRGGTGGFKAEIEFNGNTFSYNYPHNVAQNENVIVAEVTYSRKNGFSINEKLSSNPEARKVWNVNTNQFIPVTTIMHSPNYWDQNSGVGNLHYFFMLKGCVNPEKPNGFYNEFLCHDLEQHRRVFEVLGSKMAVADVDDQLSGIGFSSTKRNSVIVKVKGATERVLVVMI